MRNIILLLGMLLLSNLAMAQQCVYVDSVYSTAKLRELGNRDIKFGIRQIVEDELKAAGIPPIGTIVEKNNLKFKFQTAEQQIAAKSISEKILGNEFVVALNLISNSPQWLSSFGALPMYLGLDLRGGVHFLMELDLSKVSERKNDGLLSDLRRMMREEKIQYYDSQINGSTIQIKFKQKGDLDKVKDIVRDMGSGRSIFGGKGPAKETEAFYFFRN